ncbi:MAG: 30S ribosomal protein S18 [Nitrospirae bacterium]|nr:30S ribosomal protein S18 [Nitrospirota bacterium]
MGFFGRGRGKGKGRKGPRRPSARRGRGRSFRRCRFCADPNLEIDYKNVHMLRTFLTERYKIVSSRQSRVCVWHQRKLNIAIRRARMMALLPFTISNRLPPDVLG